MVTGYLAKCTHRTTRVECHKIWLDARNCKELPDWADAGEDDCVFGAVICGMLHGGFQKDTVSAAVSFVALQGHGPQARVAGTFR